MNNNLLISIFLLFAMNLYGQKKDFGHITITPYISDKVDLNEPGKRQLETKLNQIVTYAGVTGGFDRRFIITPNINVCSESTTATIPQKTSIKTDITFFIGDGVTGNLFGSVVVKATGVGDNHQDALCSAIKKIKIDDEELQSLISICKKRIIEYYDAMAPDIIKEAKEHMNSGDYETALSKLALIPSLCDEYNTAQGLISECGGRLIAKDNDELIMKAKAAWSRNPNSIGASEASEYIAQINITSPSVKREVDKLTNQIETRLIQSENKKLEIEKAKIVSQENLERAKIEASSRVTTSFFEALPDIAYYIFRWF